VWVAAILYLLVAGVQFEKSDDANCNTVNFYSLSRASDSEPET
jgi:hypothetical protein